MRRHTSLSNAGDERLRQAALTHGVLQTANQNAQEALRGQLGLLGFQEIRFL